MLGKNEGRKQSDRCFVFVIRVRRGKACKCYGERNGQLNRKEKMWLKLCWLSELLEDSRGKLFCDRSD